MTDVTPKRKYYLKNKAKIVLKNREYMHTWQQENREIANERARKSYQKHKEARVEQARQRRENDPSYQTQYRAANREECNARTRDWQKRNRYKVTATGAKYRATKLNATPSWLTVEDRANITAFYLEANRLTKLTGIQFEVDHIVPLQGKGVCGLHVPYNLAILTRYENAAKGNKQEYR